MKPTQTQTIGYLPRPPSSANRERCPQAPVEKGLSTMETRCGRARLSPARRGPCGRSGGAVRTALPTRLRPARGVHAASAWAGRAGATRGDVRTLKRPAGRAPGRARLAPARRHTVGTPRRRGEDTAPYQPVTPPPAPRTGAACRPPPAAPERGRPRPQQRRTRVGAGIFPHRACRRTRCDRGRSRSGSAAAAGVPSCLILIPHRNHTEIPTVTCHAL